MAYVKLRKIEGEGLAIVLPAELVRGGGLAEGDRFEATAGEGGVTARGPVVAFEDWDDAFEKTWARYRGALKRLGEV